MKTEEDYTGCLLCVHGRFIPGPHPQQVDCSKLGKVKERDECSEFEGQPIEEKDHPTIK